MGNILIINNADFSKNSVNKLKTLDYAGLIVNAKYGWCTLASTSGTRLSQDPDMGAIYIPSGGSIIISGLKGISSSIEPLSFDYCYYTSNIIPTTELLSEDLSGPASNCVGTGSNLDSSRYFFLNNDGSSDKAMVTNIYGQNYYFAMGFRGINGGSLSSNNYNLTWIRV